MQRKFKFFRPVPKDKPLHFLSPSFCSLSLGPPSHVALPVSTSQSFPECQPNLHMPHSVASLQPGLAFHFSSLSLFRKPSRFPGVFPGLTETPLNGTSVGRQEPVLPELLSPVSGNRLPRASLVCLRGGAFCPACPGRESLSRHSSGRVNICHSSPRPLHGALRDGRSQRWHLKVAALASPIGSSASRF